MSRRITFESATLAAWGVDIDTVDVVAHGASYVTLAHGSPTHERILTLRRSKPVPPRAAIVATGYAAVPVDRWRELHTRSALPVVDPAAESKWIEGLADDLPARCSCRSHWQVYLQSTPPVLGTPAAYEAWAVDAHNAVNTRLRRPLMTMQQAREAHAPTPPADGPPAIWIAGYPSLVGGSDTEAWHVIRLLRRHGVDVHAVPVGQADPLMRQAMDAVGAFTHVYRPDIFRGRTVVSWCNGEFLTRLPEIVAAGRPARVLWANCMTWLFPDEVRAQRSGWIDQHLFVSAYQRSILVPLLKLYAPVQDICYRPFFDVTDTLQAITFAYRPPADHFAVGRISRADPSKFTTDMWQTFAAVRSPLPLKAFILGYDVDVQEKTGSPPDGLDWMTWTAGAIRTAELLGRLHCMIHHTGGSRESYGRCVIEAMAAGVPVITENAYAFPELIENGVTGFLCEDGPEMAARASELAADEPKRRDMIYAARDRLDAIAGDAVCWPAWAKLFNITNNEANND